MKTSEFGITLSDFVVRNAFFAFCVCSSCVKGRFASVGCLSPFFLSLGPPAASDEEVRPFSSLSRVLRGDVRPFWDEIFSSSDPRWWFLRVISP
jgi:hypothetical protein